MTKENIEQKTSNSQKITLNTLEQVAEPITKKMNDIMQMDRTIEDYFLFLGQSNQKPNAKQSSNTLVPEERFTKLYCYIALAINPETGPKLKELLEQQLIMQRDMLDLLEEALEKQELAYVAGGVTKYKSAKIATTNVMDCNTINDVNITMGKLHELLNNFNNKLNNTINIDKTKILDTLNLLRESREQIMEQHLANLTKVLEEQAQH